MTKDLPFDWDGWIFVITSKGSVLDGLVYFPPYATHASITENIILYAEVMAKQLKQPFDRSNSYLAYTKCKISQAA